MRSAELDQPEGLQPHPGLVDDPRSPFATDTMADLLERQGHDAEARVVRARAVSRALPTEPERRRVLDTLERWLEQLRRPRR
jgi:streptomycin 6-kinase